MPRVGTTGAWKTRPFTRFAASGLAKLNCFPQIVMVTERYEPSRVASFEQRILAILTAEEAAEWRESVARAKTHKDFLLCFAAPLCVGTKLN
jgi:hypothetical protein